MLHRDDDSVDELEDASMCGAAGLLLALPAPPAAAIAAAPAGAVPLVSFVGDLVGGADRMAILRPCVFRGATVRFDRWIHQSGILRAYTKCAEPTHRACVRYRYCNQFPTTEEVAAYLIGWCELSPGLTREQHQERGCKPTAARMAEVAAKLRA